MTFYVGISIILFLTEALAALNYLLLQLLSKLIFPKKAKNSSYDKFVENLENQNKLNENRLGAISAMNESI